MSEEIELVLDPHSSDLVQRGAAFAKAVAAASNAEARRLYSGDDPTWALLARVEAEAAYRKGEELLDALVVSESYWVRLWKERGEARLAHIASLAKAGLSGPVHRPPTIMADAEKVRAAVLELYSHGMTAITNIAAR
jgi:hypothetical protein